MSAPKTVLELLQAIRVGLTEEQWAAGRCELTESKECIVTFAVHSHAAFSIRHTMYQMFEQVNGQEPGYFNDSHTHSEVMSALDRTIAYVKEHNNV